MGGEGKGEGEGEEEGEWTKVTLSFLKSVKAKGMYNFFRSKDLSYPSFQEKEIICHGIRNCPCNFLLNFFS